MCDVFSDSYGIFWGVYIYKSMHKAQQIKLWMKKQNIRNWLSNARICRSDTGINFFCLCVGVRFVFFSFFCFYLLLNCRIINFISKHDSIVYLYTFFVRSSLLLLWLLFRCIVTAEPGKIYLLRYAIQHTYIH